MNSMEEQCNALVDGQDFREIEKYILSAVKQHNEWRGQAFINLHAGKNVMSRKSRELLASPGLVDNAVSGAIGRRNAMGTRFIDGIEYLTVSLLRKLFRAQYIEYRPTSGNLANGIALCALTKPGDTIMVVPQKIYGHYSWHDKGYPRHIGLRVEEIPFLEDGLTVDMKAFEKRAMKLRPTLIIVGTFITLFPTPLAEIRQLADSLGAKVMYDGPHVMGLIAGHQFQDPLTEGAHILTGSTQKTLPGPIGGILACNDRDIAEKVFSVTDGLLSNYGNNRVAAMAMTSAEMLCYGRQYTATIVENAQVLAESLDSQGFHVIGKAHGYTASHQVIIDATSWGGGREAAALLEKVNIICTHFALSSDLPDSPENRNGVRLGVSAVTRLGMGKDEMIQISHLMRETLQNPENTIEIQQKIKDLAARFYSVQYSFDF